MNEPASIGEPHRVEPLIHNTLNRATGGIWRVHGTNGTAIKKQSRRRLGGPRRWRTSDDPQHWNHWRREYLAYTEGLTQLSCGGSGLRPPELLDASESTDETTLWIEDVHGAPGVSWGVEGFATFARRLGRAQSVYVNRVPDVPWLSRGWLRQYVGAIDVAEPITWDHPLAVRAWPESLRVSLARLWHRRDAMLATAEAMPRTLCHLDVWPMNLIEDGESTVLLDWAFIGDGAVGEDIGNLIPDTVADGWFDSDLLPEIMEATMESYVTGLRDGGWNGDADLVRRAIAISGAVKYAWIAPTMVQRLAAGARLGSIDYDQRDDPAHILAERRPMLETLVSWATDTGHI